MLILSRAKLHVSTLILGCRNLTKGNAAREEILAHCKPLKPVVQVWQIDMASYQSVQAFAKRLDTDLTQLDAVILNAGISTNEYKAAEQFEATLTVNFVSTFLLGFLVLPQLRKTAELTNAPTHLAFVGSNVHAFADASQLQQPSDGKILSTLSDESNADMAARYFLSKLMVMLCVRELAVRTTSKKANGPEIIINCLSPGWCKTELFRQDDGGFMGRSMLKLIGRTSESGARCLTSAIAAGSETHGAYVSECRKKRPSVFVRSSDGAAVQQKLWKELVATIEQISPHASQSIV
ncbi:hypothetical protein MRB53_037449 [Persea americana]|nr:hypothetical protein MRB53_037449 [Persea americana]